MPNAGHVARSVAIGDCEPVCKKQEIESSSFKNFCDVHIMIEAKKFGLALWIAPYRVAMHYRTGNKEAAKMHLFLLSHLKSPWKLSMSMRSAALALRSASMKQAID